jgi:hypothetical protein
MATRLEKLGWWIDSVRGLYFHVKLYRFMVKEHRRLELHGPQALEQLRRQETMVGHCFLHVILVHKVGSGRFF